MNPRIEELRKMEGGALAKLARNLDINTREHTSRESLIQAIFRAEQESEVPDYLRDEAEGIPAKLAGIVKGVFSKLPIDTGSKEKLWEVFQMIWMSRYQTKSESLDLLTDIFANPEKYPEQTEALKAFITANFTAEEDDLSFLMDLRKETAPVEKPAPAKPAHTAKARKPLFRATK